ncbi:pyridoxamine 5'-phosphate oxidase family protein [Hoyosella subflava]|uniref:pyridoxamine 5'-phosphate oxidase family protein n=1 Tax=Hoyosella subflava TaxID=639313 RepID=UPI00192CCA99|nr:pyridoxamine 5'-phosphate oxidase family protein [Hoyosella subflava]
MSSDHGAGQYGEAQLTKDDDMSAPPALARPESHLDPRYSEPAAAPAEWVDVQSALERAELYWLSTVRNSGQPHVTPLIGVWSSGAFWFCTGAHEQKARNVAANPRATAVTGVNSLRTGIDIAVEGSAQPVHDELQLRAIAAAYLAKYGQEWTFEVRDGHFEHPDGGRAVVYRLTPTTAYAYTKGTYSQTRFTFEADVRRQVSAVSDA